MQHRMAVWAHWPQISHRIYRPSVSKFRNWRQVMDMDEATA